jgi:ribonuclease HI
LDRELLRDVYRHLDLESLLRKHPGMTEAELRDFFRKLDRLLPMEQPPVQSCADDESVVLNADGGSRGNPGPAGYGFVLKESSGRVLCERGGFIGRATNNEAEYAGLLAGLEAALEAGARRILARLDSELLVKQLNGAYKVKSRNLMPYFLKARQILERFESWRVEHVRRELNSRADELANEAMDRGA